MKILLLLSLLFASACTTQVARKTPATTVKALNDLNIVAEKGANKNTTTSLDIVMIYDPSVTGTLPKTATDWFARKYQLISDIAGRVEIVSLQIPPGTSVPVPLPARIVNASAVYAYVNYPSKPNQPAANLTRYQKATIYLKPEAVALSKN
ncbi:hypothetical protein [uncultured Bdellovibrio sp.]|uniref:hypothetical protein n=1 Tax=Bdellovibrio sp. HCB-162 TaxID=3394234 RepID=UPI0025E85C50|nr:hypothetical protein [uncultured Bdellovibrio sp.]